jgi:hypothetical protein
MKKKQGVLQMQHPYREVSIHYKLITITYLGNAYYHSVQNLLPLQLLSKNIKIKIPMFCMRLKLGPSPQARTQNLRFENRVLRRISGPKGEEVTVLWIESESEKFYFFIIYREFLE